MLWLLPAHMVRGLAVVINPAFRTGSQAKKKIRKSGLCKCSASETLLDSDLSGLFLRIIFRLSS